MAIYGIRVTPLINMLIDILPNEYSANINVMFYADDFSAAGNLQDLRRWWSGLTEIDRKFGYYPERTKTWLVVKSSASEKIESVFLGAKIKITAERRIYLGGSIDSWKFKDLYVRTKVNEGIIQFELLWKIAAIESPSSYCAFTAVSSLS